jgi:hypothetical protein
VLSETSNKTQNLLIPVYNTRCQRGEGKVYKFIQIYHIKTVIKRKLSSFIRKDKLIMFLYVPSITFEPTNYFLKAVYNPFQTNALFNFISINLLT